MAGFPGSTRMPQADHRLHAGISRRTSLRHPSARTASGSGSRTLRPAPRSLAQSRQCVSPSTAALESAQQLHEPPEPAGSSLGYATGISAPAPHRGEALQHPPSPPATRPSPASSSSSCPCASPSAPSPDAAATATASAPRWSRRAALLALPFGSWLAGGGWPLLGPSPASASAVAAAAAARPLRSLGWRVPCELTVLNDLDRPLKMYWLNYDGDPELFGSLSPGSVFTVHTFESHAWRFVDSVSGSTLAEHVAGAGQQLVRLASKAAAAAAAGGAAAADSSGSASSYTYTAAPPQALRDGGGGGGGAGGAPDGVAAAPSTAAGDAQAEAAPRERRAGPAATAGTEAAQFDGFDGLGNDEASYTLAQLREVSIYPGGGTVLLSLPASPLAAPLEVALAGPEALSLVTATGSLEQRRPSTLGTWSRSLLAAGVELRRVCITRMVDGIFYCRLILSRPDASLASLDATPGDSLSLALQLGRPIFVANEVARVHQSVFDVFARRREAMEAAAASGRLDEAAEAEADRQAQEALDSITRALPSAPRPVRALQMEHGLDA